MYPFLAIHKIVLQETNSGVFVIRFQNLSLDIEPFFGCGTLKSFYKEKYSYLKFSRAIVCPFSFYWTGANVEVMLAWDIHCCMLWLRYTCQMQRLVFLSMRDRMYSTKIDILFASGIKMLFHTAIYLMAN